MFDIIKDKMRDYIRKGKIDDSNISDDKMEDISLRLSNMQSASELI